MSGAVAQHGRHRREQCRCRVDGNAWIGDAERVDPANFRVEAQDLAEGIDDADEQNAEDESVQTGIGQEACTELLRLAVEDNGEQDGEDDEQPHPPEKDLRVGKLSLVSRRRCHGCRQGESGGRFRAEINRILTLAKRQPQGARANSASPPVAPPKATDRQRSPSRAWPMPSSGASEASAGWSRCRRPRFPSRASCPCRRHR